MTTSFIFLLYWINSVTFVKPLLIPKKKKKNFCQLEAQINWLFLNKNNIIVILKILQQVLLLEIY